MHSFSVTPPILTVESIIRMKDPVFSSSLNEFKNLHYSSNNRESCN